MSQGFEPKPLPDDLFEGDTTLRDMLLIVALHEGQMPITLSLNGTVITGKLIGPREYLYLFGESQKIITSDSTVQEVYQKIGDDLKARMESNYRTDPILLKGHFDTFYLKDAFFVLGTVLVPQTGMLWRGRTSQIDGFSQTQLTQA